MSVFPSRVVPAVLSLLLWQSEARACPSCASGDPTLMAMGAELPVTGRWRVAFDSRLHTDGVESADPLAAYALTELRFGASASFVPAPDWVLSATVPVLLRRQAQQAGVVQQVGLGSVETRVKRILVRDRAFAPRHLLALTAGLSAPFTQQFEGAWEPSLGLSYNHLSGGPLSLFTSVTGALPLASPAQGASVTGTLMGQAQLHPALALRLGLDCRWQDAGQPVHEHAHGPADEEVTHPHSQSIAMTSEAAAAPSSPHGAGTLGYAAAELLFRIGAKATVVGGVRLPVYAELGPQRWEGLFASVGVVLDL